MHYSLKRAATWNILGYLYLLLAALYSTPVLLHSLGATSFGVYSLILATLYLVSSIDLGMSQAVVRQLAIRREFSRSRQTLWATSSLIFISTGLVAATAACLITAPLHLSLALYPVIFALALISNLVAHYSTLPQAEGHFGYFNLKTFIVGTANTILAAYLARSGFDILIIMLALLASYFLTLLSLAYFSLKFFPRPRDGVWSAQVAKDLLAFGLKNQLGKFIAQAQTQYGKYLLAMFAPLYLTPYIIAQGLVQKLVAGVAQLASAFYPASTYTLGSRKVRSIYYHLELLLLALCLVGLYLYNLFGYSFLSWWLNDAGLASTIHSFIMTYRYYGILLVFTALPSTILEGQGHPGTTTLLAGAAFLIELVSVLFLFPHYGLLSLAYGGIIGLSILLPVLLYITEKTLSPE